MTFTNLLIANRGEIAIRIARAAADLGLDCTAIYSIDDERSLHVRAADRAVPLPAAGAKAYLDIAGIIAAAKSAGATRSTRLRLPGRKRRFRPRLRPGRNRLRRPLPRSPRGLRRQDAGARHRDSRRRAGDRRDGGPADLPALEAFLDHLPPGAAMIVKAVAGGGGRGLRVVRERAELTEALASASREAEAAFGVGAVYAERYVDKARHIEVQVAGDRTGVLAIGERDCSLQRRHQKIIEIAPAPNLPEPLRARLFEAAVNIAAAARYRNSRHPGVPAGR